MAQQIPATITLTTADAGGAATNEDGWQVVRGGYYQANLGGTWGSANASLQCKDADGNWSTLETWDDDAVPLLALASGFTWRFFLTAVGAGASVDILIRRFGDGD